MATVGRQTVRLSDPPKDPARLRGFPDFRLRRGRTLFRAHSVGNGPWWFASDEGGRFNLESPLGTCYLGVDVETAVRERLGNDLEDCGTVSERFADEMAVSELKVPAGGMLADTCSRDAVRFQVTRTIHTYVDPRYGYAKTRTWASAFHALGFRGIRYLARFTSITEPNAFALFGDEGDAGQDRGWAADPAPMPGAQACRVAGLTVLPPPKLRAVRIIPPPTRPRGSS